MVRVFKTIFTLNPLFLIFFLTACTAPNSSDETDSSAVKGTKSANITISDTALMGARSEISATEIGDYLLPSQTVDNTSSFSITLYNNGDVAAEKIKAYSLESPLAYLGGSYPGTGGTCGKTIAPGGSCSVLFTFTATAIGQGSSTFRLGYYNGKTTRIFEKVFKATAYSVPTITSVTPAIGPALGGTTISLAGTHLFTGAKVTLAGKICTASYVPPTGISCVIPSNPVGSVDIVVTNTDGRTYTFSGFSYVPAPVLTSISPTAGALAGGTAITLSGSNFYSGISVTVGSNACAPVNLISSTTLSCTTSAHAAQATDVVVTNADGQVSSLVSGYTYQAAPTVTIASPSSGLISGGEYVTITGTNFMTGVTASIGGAACESLTRNSSTSLLCVAPHGSLGNADIVVTNSDGQTGTGSALYSFTTGESWTTLTTANIPRIHNAGAAVWTGSKVIIFGGSWTENTGSVFDPVTSTSTAVNTNGAPPIAHIQSSVWTGSKMIVWGGYNALNASPNDYFNQGGQYDPVNNTWTAITTTGAPSKRSNAKAVWTGSKMIIWGGGGTINDGAMYDPELNNWTLMSSTNTPANSFIGVWTGKYLLTMGGKYDPLANTWTTTSTTGYPFSCYFTPHTWTGKKLFISCDGIGYLYDFDADSWSTASTVGAPPLKEGAQVTWTGSRVIVFGGYDLPNRYLNGPPSNTGYLYDPESNSWEQMTSVNTALGRYSELPSLWTGKQMFLWGGGYVWSTGAAATSGGLYTPPVPSTSNSWTRTTTTGAMGVRDRASIVWTGSKAIIYGGWSCGGSCGDGFIYDPVANSWTRMPDTTIRIQHNSVWMGSRMFTWGGSTGFGNLNTGEIYDPILNNWTAITTIGAPSSRISFGIAWTGSKVLVGPGDGLNDGGLYDPLTDTWTAITTTGAPPIRQYTSFAWTDSKLILFGGYHVGLSRNTGGIYTVATDTWIDLPTTNAPSPRCYNTSSWSGSKFFVWGGTFDLNTTLNTGGLYDVAAGTWSSTTTQNAPESRYVTHSAWTGSEFIIWGGALAGGDVTATNTGGKYSPFTDSWKSTTTTNAPTGVQRGASVWTGSKFFLFGGNTNPSDGFQITNAGGLYTP